MLGTTTAATLLPKKQAPCDALESSAFHHFPPSVSVPRLILNREKINFIIVFPKWGEWSGFYLFFSIHCLMLNWDYSKRISNTHFYWKQVTPFYDNHIILPGKCFWEDVCSKDVNKHEQFSVSFHGLLHFGPQMCNSFLGPKTFSFFLLPTQSFIPPPSLFSLSHSLRAQPILSSHSRTSLHLASISICPCKLYSQRGSMVQGPKSKSSSFSVFILFDL